MLPAFLDATATEQSTDFPTRNERASLNFFQMGRHPWTNPPSPANSLSSRTASPASFSCPTISSLETRRSTSLDPEQSQTPIFPLSDLASSDSATLTTHSNSSAKPLNQQVLCARADAVDIPSSQQPTISLAEENELDDLRWSTGVPRHMMDVFRANPFTAMDLSRATNTTLPSLDSSTTADSIHCTNGDSLLSVPTAKRKLSKSPDSVEPRRKGRQKRARIQSLPVVPFPATGPQEMYAYEFRVDVDPPYWSMEFSCVETNGWSNRSSVLGLVYGHEHLLAAQSGVAHHSEDTRMRLPMDRGDVASSLPSPFSYQYSHSASFPARAGSGHYMHPSYLPFLPPAPLHAQMSPCFGAVSNSLVPASRVEKDESWTRFEERECGSLPSVVPTRVRTENIQTRPSSATPLATSPRKPLYACPRCPRDFQLPNGLALHLKWHDRVSSSTGNLAVWQGQPRNRTAVKVTRTELCQPGGRDLSNIQSSDQGDGREGVTSGMLFSSRGPIQGPNLVPAEAEQYTNSLSFENQPQECALFHDALQLNDHASLPLESNTYLAPLDGLSVLQPLPFEQYRVLPLA
ncbi:hypothetical protein BJY52DRAFT_681773 [Lactarius psammicola]|nr:hypothetical protein BJY52DRAFT_681773 [Lactarius psammicola]